MLLRVRLEGGTVCEWCVCSEKAVTNTLRTKGQLLGTQAYTRREQEIESPRANISALHRPRRAAAFP